MKNQDQEQIRLQARINNEKYEVIINKYDTFEELIEFFKQNKIVPIQENQSFLFTSTDKHGMTLKYLLYNQMNAIQKNENGNYQIDISWQGNPNVKIKLQFQGKTYPRIVNRQDTVEKILNDIKTQFKISSKDELLVKVYVRQESHQVKNQEKVKTLIKRYGVDLRLVIIPMYNQSFVKIKYEPFQSNISLKSQKVDNVNKKSSEEAKINRGQGSQSQLIQIFIEMDDLGSKITKQFSVPKTYSFADLRPQIDFQFSQFFHEWDQNGNEQLSIVDADSANKNRFTKLDQSFKRIFGNQCNKRTFLLSRVYPGG